MMNFWEMYRSGGGGGGGEEEEEEEEANPPTDPLLPFASNLLAFHSKSLSPDPGGFFRLLPRSE